LELSGGRATGVRIRGRGRRERVISASREVILSAGAIGSPRLLLLSGIGAADQLRSVGVPVAHDMPGVGENLHDHPYVVCVWESTVPESLYGAAKPKSVAGRLGARGRQAQAGGGVARGPQRAADVDGRRGVRVRAYAPGPSGGRRPVPLR